MSYNKISTADVYFDEATSVYRWRSNDRIPPADAIVKYGIDKLPNFDGERTFKQRDIENAVVIAQYREAMKNHVPSDEERFEMRAAFGEGQEVVNVFTGQKYRT